MKKSRKFLILFGINVLVSLILAAVFMYIVFSHLPNLGSLYAELGTDLPVFTRFLIDVSELFTKYWFLFVPLVLVTTFVIPALLALAMKKLDTKLLVVVYILIGLASPILIVTILVLIGSMPIYNLAGTLN